MNRYIFEYYSKTRAALNSSKDQQTTGVTTWEYNYPNLHDCELKIVIKDKVVRRDNVNLHIGLNFFADIKIDSENEAKEIVRENVEQIINMISFSTLTYCTPAILVSIININPDSSPFTHYPEQIEETINISIVKIDKSIFGKIHEAYEKNNEKPRIERTLTWLRKGMGEELHVDEFISYWIGLEVIKHLLSKEKLNSKRYWRVIEVIKYLVLKEKTENKHEWDRVKEIFENELKFNNFNKVKQNGRNGLLHGFKQLDSVFIEEINSYIEPIRKTLVYCICSVLNLESTIKIKLLNSNLHKDPDTKLIFNANLENLPNDLNSIIQNPPKLDGGIVEKHYSINEDGETTMNVKTSHKFSCGNNIKCTGVKLGLWGNKDAGIKQAKMGEITINKSE